MGGGVDQVPLTADLCARAIIAAAQAFGDDPVVSATTTARHRRRALVAAAGGLAAAEVCTVNLAAKVMGVAPTSVSTARNMNRSGYRDAERAAMRAVEFACWRPEAAESVAGGASDGAALETADEGLSDALAALADVMDAEPEPDPQVPAPAPTPREIPIRTDAAGLTRTQHRPPGKIAADLRPAQPVPSSLPGGERPIRDLVLEALAGGPLNSMSIAAIIDRKEMPVSSCLNALASEGLAESQPASSGPRKLQWRLTRKAQERAA